MAEPLAPALAQLRDLLLDDTRLVRAVAAGRRRGHQSRWRRVDLRYVDLKGARHLQVVRYDQTQAHTSNHRPPDDEVDRLLAEPFGNWHVETTDRRIHLRVTKSGEAQVNQQQVDLRPDHEHDRKKQRHLPDDHPVLAALGIADAQGRIKPGRQAKFRQVEEFLRELAATLTDAEAAGLLPAHEPLRVVDLGCGNAYLTFGAAAWLSEEGRPFHIVGVDVKEQSRRHNEEIARHLGYDDRVAFRVGRIEDVALDDPPHVVLALHACDTATDEALARAVRWQAPVVLAAPCCHQDISQQLRRSVTPLPYPTLVQDGILRERFADTLTDGLRAALLRAEGYRVDVVEFIDSAHTPRNTLLRAVRTGRRGGRSEYVALVHDWGVTPRLAELLR